MAIKCVGFAFLFLSLPAMAISPSVDPIQFTNTELQAAYTLVRPELSKFEFHGEKGKFDPAPAIKFLGVDAQEFNVDLRTIGDILDLRFYHLNAKAPTLRFEAGELIIEVPLEDNASGFRSALGAIGVRDAGLKAALNWKMSPTGQYDLKLKSVSYRGTLLGSGVFRSGFLLRKAKKLLIGVLENQVQKMLNKTEVQANIQKGLLQWARAYNGGTFTQIVPDTLEFFEAGEVSGIRYQVAH